jgi:hypothetical protein
MGGFGAILIFIETREKKPHTGFYFKIRYKIELFWILV